MNNTDAEKKIDKELKALTVIIWLSLICKGTIALLAIIKFVLEIAFDL